MCAHLHFMVVTIRNHTRMFSTNLQKYCRSITSNIYLITLDPNFWYCSVIFFQSSRVKKLAISGPSSAKILHAKKVPHAHLRMFFAHTRTHATAKHAHTLATNPLQLTMCTFIWHIIHLIEPCWLPQEILDLDPFSTFCQIWQNSISKENL